MVESVARTDVRVRTWMAIGLFLAITGGRLLFLASCSTDLPQFDAWGVEGDQIYRPYLNGTLRLSDFFIPCNEHRVVFTRLLSLLLLVCNDLWDNRLQGVVNALICAATGTVLFRIALTRLGFSAAAFLWLLLLAAYAVPFGWENALWGFQSQFYLLAAVSVAALYMALGRERHTAADSCWSVILQCAALFTMASGVLASAAILLATVAVAMRNRDDQSRRRRIGVHLAISTLIIIVWKLAVYFPVPEGDCQHAPSLAAFVAMLGHCLSWPLVSSPWWCFVAWLPWLLLCGNYLLRRCDDRGVERFTMALGIWVILQAVAIAYARWDGALISKYADPLSLGMVANGLAIVLLAEWLQRRWRWGLFAGAAIWTVVAGYALYGQYRGAVGYILPQKQETYAIQLERTRGFLSTGDFSFLIPEGKHEIPDWRPESYARRLTDPILVAILPRSVNQRYQQTGRPAAFLSRGADLLLAVAAPLLVLGVLAASCSLALRFRCRYRYQKETHASAEMKQTMD